MAIKTDCHDCGETNYIDATDYISIEEGCTTSCEYCGSKNIEVEYGVDRPRVNKF